MNKKQNYLWILFLTCSFEACQNTGKPTYTQLENCNWLIGEWKNYTEKGEMIETWKQKNDSTFVGYSCFLVQKDTVSSETISLEQRGTDLFYIPTVENQNEGKAVLFKKIVSTAKELVFENPRHDFPQKISYTQITEDSLVAEISGLVGGELRRQQFPLKRAE